MGAIFSITSIQTMVELFTYGKPQGKMGVLGHLPTSVVQQRHSLALGGGGGAPGHALF